MINSEHAMDSEHAGAIGNYNPVNVSDTVGVMLLGVIAFVLLIALLRAQARNRALLAQLARPDAV